VIPAFGYCRQDKKEKASTPVTTKLVANLLQVAGVNRILTVDLHSSQIQGFFDVPVDNIVPDLYTIRFLKTLIWNDIKVPDPSDFYLEAAVQGSPSASKTAPSSLHSKVAVVSCGVSNVERAQKFASALHASLACVHFGKLSPGGIKSELASTSDSFSVVGDVKGKIAILVQDMADTCAGFSRISDVLIEHGARVVYVAVTHGVFSEGGIDRLESSSIHRLIMTNTVPLKHASEKIVLINIAPLIAEAMRRIHNGESIAYLFTHVPDTEVHLSVEPFTEPADHLDLDDTSPRQILPKEELPLGGVNMV